MDTMELDFSIDNGYQENGYEDFYSSGIDDYDIAELENIESEFGIEQYDEDFINSL